MSVLIAFVALAFSMVRGSDAAVTSTDRKRVPLALIRKENEAPAGSEATTEGAARFSKVQAQVTQAEKDEDEEAVQEESVAIIAPTNRSSIEAKDVPSGATSVSLWNKAGATKRHRTYEFEGTIRDAKTGRWVPRYDDEGVDGKCIFLDTASELISSKNAFHRFAAVESFLEFAPVHKNKNLDAFSLMFDFQLANVLQNQNGLVPLLQFVELNSKGVYNESKLGFFVDADGFLYFSDRKVSNKTSINKWTHIALSAQYPCLLEDENKVTSVSVFVDGSLVDTPNVFDICGKTPMINFGCRQGGMECSAPNQVYFDNLKFLEDYYNQHQ